MAKRTKQKRRNRMRRRIRKLEREGTCFLEQKIRAKPDSPEKSSVKEFSLCGFYIQEPIHFSSKDAPVGMTIERSCPAGDIFCVTDRREVMIELQCDPLDSLRFDQHFYQPDVMISVCDIGSILDWGLLTHIPPKVFRFPSLADAVVRQILGKAERRSPSDHESVKRFVTLNSEPSSETATSETLVDHDVVVQETAKPKAMSMNCQNNMAQTLIRKLHPNKTKNLGKAKNRFEWRITYETAA